MRNFLERLFTQVWYKQHPLRYLFIPFAYLYKLIVTLRRLCYQLGIYKKQHFPVPIIVVGNITVGGTGKTPLVIWLAEFLQQHGYRPGIVSRGYGGRSKRYPLHIDLNVTPKEAGDEAVLLAKETQCPVVVSPDRSAAVKNLVDTFAVNCIISDDGLQHYALARDIEIALISGERRLGNGWCLPAGPLREPRTRLTSVDFIVINGITTNDDEYAMQLVATELYNLQDPTQVLPSSAFKDVAFHAVAGIGEPQRFFNSLRQLGLCFSEHVFPDHHPFQAEDIHFDDEQYVVMTTKDAIKCLSFAGKQHWVLPVKAQLPVAFGQKLLAKLSQ